NSATNGLLSPRPPGSTLPFFDVNDDGFATGLDALLVIIFLNTGSTGEGEGSGDVSIVAEPSTGLVAASPWAAEMATPVVIQSATVVEPMANSAPVNSANTMGATACRARELAFTTDADWLGSSAATVETEEPTDELFSDSESWMDDWS
ncbi:MAG: hypothetical protein U0935_24445, partial [Pirellulales bacterium]